MPLPASAPPQLTTPTGLLTAAGRIFLQAYVALFRGVPQTAFIMWGDGSPEGVVPGPVGSVFLRTNGGASTTCYVKESGTGNTGWVAK